MEARTITPIVLDEDEPQPSSSSSSSARPFTTPNDTGKFTPNTIARLTGLSTKSDFNGKLARIGHFDEEKQRYEVWLIPEGTRNSLRPVNLQSLSIAEEVAVLGDRLKATGATVGLVRNILDRLGQLALTAELLSETKIGRVVNDMSKRFHSHPDIETTSRRLVFRWRDMFRQSQAAARMAQSAAEGQKSQMQQEQQHQQQASPTPTSANGTPPASPADDSAPAARGNDLEREKKRPRVAFAEEAVETVDVEVAVSNDVEVESSVNGSPTAMLGLEGISDQYISYLSEQPTLRYFLLKHPHVMKNLSPDNIAFLTRNIKRSTSSDQLVSDSEDTIGRTVRITNLPPDVGEPELQSLFRGHSVGKAELSIPRESRSRRTVGVGSAIFRTQADAERAIPLIRSIEVLGRRLHAEWMGAPPGKKPEDGGRRIAWKHDDELWEVALFDRFESVLTFSEHLQHPDEALDQTEAEASVEVGEITPEDAVARNMEFQRATAREHAEEANSVRQALAG